MSFYGKHGFLKNRIRDIMHQYKDYVRRNFLTHILKAINVKMQSDNGNTPPEICVIKDLMSVRDGTAVIEGFDPLELNYLLYWCSIT
jgi:hypothetical protein